MIINNLIIMKKDTNGFYIGIDSGGTKCELVILSAETDIDKTKQKIILNKVYKGIHYSLAGAEVYSNIVTKFIKDAVTQSKLNLKDCLGICFGIAGAREGKDRVKLRKAFIKKSGIKNIQITTDAMTALFGAFKGEEGIILISGTGSVLYGYSDKKIIRVGGWGRIFADEGSGYWIGKRALNLVTKEFDEKKSKKNSSLLSKKLFEKFKVTNKNVNEKIFNGSLEIQSIAPVVIECAEKKCKMSLQIIKESVEALYSHIELFLKISNINRKKKKKIKIAFIGSIIENKNLLSDKLKQEIHKMKIVEVVKKQHSPAYGAALISMEKTDLLTKI